MKEREERESRKKKANIARSNNTDCLQTKKIDLNKFVVIPRHKKGSFGCSEAFSDQCYSDYPFQQYVVYH